MVFTIVSMNVKFIVFKLSLKCDKLKLISVDLKQNFLFEDLRLSSGHKHKL